ncbi:P-loop containing nucleoside triphosphate hydrolase protein [Dipodascopsis uninucleata]
MTPVQASSIPLFCNNKDVVVEAVTGSGKTIAYVVPAVEIIQRTAGPTNNQLSGIIVAPTRELANQIYQVLNSILEFQNPSATEDDEYLSAGKEGQESEHTSRRLIRAQLLIGGANSVLVDIEKYSFDHPQLVVGTPGRLLEFLSSPRVKTSGVEVLILDEADRLLDLGFDGTINGIFHHLPKQRRTGLFSATITGAVGELVRVGLRNPVKVMVKVGEGEREQKVPSTLSISYNLMRAGSKLPALIKYIDTLKYKKAIIYFPTCASVMHFYNVLLSIRGKLKSTTTANIQLFSLHGKLALESRTKTLAKYAKATSQSVLLTTDVAARGLDIPNVDIVIQFDPPYEPNMFLHRAGRAARAGRYGEAYVFLTPGREEGFVDLMKVKKVYMMETSLGDISDVSREFYELFRKWMLESRERHEIATRAYVSMVRFYTKHTMTSIFRITDFDFLGYAKAYGLIRLPSMPELRRIPNMPKSGWLVDGFDMDSYKYSNPQKEAARLAELEDKTARTCAKLETMEAAKIKAANNSAWSKQSERRERRDFRREKKKARRDYSQKQTVTAEDNFNIIDTDSSDSELEMDWKELVTDRKRKNKISEASFDDI